MKITQWNEADRPREKLAEHGPHALSKAELLAILVGSGTQEESAVDLMRRVLGDHQDDLHKVERLSIEELCEYNGIGPAKAITIKAACEIANRYAREKALEREDMSEPEHIAMYFRSIFGNAFEEQCHVMLLDPKLRLIGTKLVSKGGVSFAAVDVRSVMREALLAGACRIVLCHNHPSGSCSPSKQDIDLTKTIQNAGRTLNIPMIDHIIITRDDYYSFHEHNQL